MELRDRVFAAVETGDLARVEALCREEREAIVAALPAWQQVPEELRADPAELQRYANVLITVARVFAERLGDPRLMQQLAGGDDNPLARWDAELQAAIEDMEALRYAEARGRLEQLLDVTNPLRGTGADQLRPITLAYLAECMFQLGDAEGALPYYELALEGVRAIGDAAGIAAYHESLYELNRYLGRSEAAARHADELASLHAGTGRAADADRLRRRAAIARAGEPKNRVVATLAGGSTVELDEVQTVTGRIRFSFQRDRVALRRANALVEEGERLGAAGQLEDALAKFREAARVDPAFPHARYQEGFTLVLLRRYDEAVAAYAATEELAPGWFHCRADLAVARRLAAGTLDHAAFEALRELEDGSGTPEAKLALADRAIARDPDVAGFHLERGRQLALLGRTDEARSALRDGLARDPDPDIHTRLLVQLAILVDDPAARTQLFEEAVRLDGNLIAAATARLALRQG